MRVLMLVHSLRRGGAERVLLELSLALQKRGHAVEVVSWLDVDEYREGHYMRVSRHYLLRRDDYRWIWSIPHSAGKLRKIARGFRPDVIEIHTPNAAWLAAWAGLGVPCVYVLHGYGPITRYRGLKGGFIIFFSRLAARKLNAAFITVSGSMTEAASGYFHAGREHFHCVPNGVDLQKFPHRDRPPAAVPSILMIGTLSRNKGQALGIRAFKALLDHMENARLGIVGDGPDRKSLEYIAKFNGLEEKIEFLGRREDVPEILASSHILWQLSDSEGMPMVVLEAMASGIPAIGFDVRGTRDAVVCGQTGCLVRHGDIGAVARQTADLLKDGARYQNFSINSRRRAEQLFNLELMAGGHERVLQSAASR